VKSSPENFVPRRTAREDLAKVCRLVYPCDTLKQRGDFDDSDVPHDHTYLDGLGQTTAVDGLTVSL
jgi:hypothetical protein